MNSKHLNASFIFIIGTFLNLNLRIYGTNGEQLIREISNDGCALIEPVYNYTFEFGKLHSDFGHRIQNELNDVIDFNVCGNLSKSCKKNSNSSALACLTRRNGKEEVILGRKHILTYNNGKMYFTFINGEPCKGNQTYSLIVLLTCSYILDKQPFYIPPYSNGDGCSIYIHWKTPLACLPESKNAKNAGACSKVDLTTGHTFDLSPLSDSNHRASNRNGSFFLINICRPVHYGENALCPAGSGVCFVNESASILQEKYLNFGNAAKSFDIKNDELIMELRSSTRCTESDNVTSLIRFSCNPTVKFGEPEFIGRNGCSYEFVWQTSLACGNVPSCTAIDPKTKFEYDLISLSSKQYTVQEGGKIYKFAVCSDSGPPCLDRSGSCEVSGKQSVTLGITNDHLRFNATGTPYLLYTKGAICLIINSNSDKKKDETMNENENRQEWSTKIEFVCPISKGYKDSGGSSSSTSSINTGVAVLNEPKVIENSNCQVLIHFPTELVCQKQISCKTEGYASGEEIDLTSLISTTENYLAKVNESLKMNNTNSYFLNVCRPLVPQYGLGCPAGSAACKTTMGATTPENEESLGYPDVSLTMIDSSTAELKYLGGDLCPSDRTLQLSSSIKFICNPKAGKGFPLLQSIVDECHYQFDWETNAICSSHLCEFSMATCEVINDQLNEKFSLEKANFTNNGKIMIKSQKPFWINLCGPGRKAITDYSQSTVKIFFSVNGPCGLDGIIKVEVRLSCNETNHRSIFTAEDTCSLVITQNTPEICKFLSLPVPKVSKKVVSEENRIKVNATKSTTATVAEINKTSVKTNENSSSKKQEETFTAKDHSEKEKHPDEGKSFSILAVVLTIVIFVLVSYIFVKKNGIARIRNIFTRRRSNTTGYSRVANNEESDPLVGYLSVAAESDEDLLL